jgi:enamine deaminase RidA (YjgF/YER057c/UK114 family)
MEELVEEPVEEVVSDQIVLDSSADTASSSVQIQNVGMLNFGEVLQPPPQMHIVNMVRLVTYDNPVRDIVPYMPLDLQSLRNKAIAIEKTFSAQVFGPVLPPDMLWNKMFESWLPEIMTAKIPIAFRSCSFTMIIHAKRSWADAFQQVTDFPTSRTIQQFDCSRPPPRRMVARALKFSDEEVDDGQDGECLPPVFASSPLCTPKRKTRGKAKRYDTPLVACI